jgi:hypothetical protein
LSRIEPGEVELMNKHRGQLYLAHSSSPAIAQTGEQRPGKMSEISTEEVAEYIACLLHSVRIIAYNAQLKIVAELIKVAEEQAREHFS